VEVMNKKEIIVGALVGLGTLFGLGLLYKFYKKKTPTIETKKETEPATLEIKKEIDYKKILIAIIDIGNSLYENFNQKEFSKLVEKYESIHGFDSEVLMHLILTSGDIPEFLSYFNKRLSSGQFSGEVRLKDFNILLKLENENPLIQSILFHYFKLCSTLFVKEFESKKVTNNIAYALGIMISLENNEFSEFCLDFVYNLVLKNLNSFSLDSYFDVVGLVSLEIFSMWIGCCLIPFVSIKTNNSLLETSCCFY
jgi:hypothetical protein